MSKKANTPVNNAPIAALAAPQFDAEEGYTTILGEHRVKQVFHDSIRGSVFFSPTASAGQRHLRTRRALRGAILGRAFRR